MIPYRHDRKRKSSIQGQANGNIHKAVGIKNTKKTPYKTSIHIPHENPYIPHNLLPPLTSRRFRFVSL